jgi:trehalose/maltose transport system substrate-binding protein
LDSTSARRMARARSLLLLALPPVLLGCGRVDGPRSKDEGGTTVTAMLGGWAAAQPQDVMRASLARFTRESGNAVRLLPSPQGKRHRLERYQQWLGEQAKTPDVYHADVTEISRLADHMVDLRPYLAKEAETLIPAVMSNYVIDGRLVAMPLYTDVGVLLYRIDLLKKYALHPPQTWDELRASAQRIQAGERAAGNPDFWGFSWPGAPSDDLFCAALEMQASFGGGQIVERNQTISVNNPHAAKALETMRNWVGTISPRGITAYGPDDARNLWYTGNAAFLRSWPNAYATSQNEHSVIRGKVAVTLLPSGGHGHVTTIGGWQLSVSKYSPHPQQAAALVGFLTSREQQRQRAITLSGLPLTLELYDDPEVVAANPYFRQIKEAFVGGTVSRPSTLPGREYDEVTRTYVDAVHAVLLGQTPAREALAALETRLVAITRFPSGPPLPRRNGAPRP